MSAARALLDAEEDPAKIPFEWQGIVTSIVIVIGLIILFSNKIRTEMVMIGMLVTLVLCQVIAAEDAVSGFASTSVLTVMALFAVAEGITQTGALEAFFRKVLGRPKTSPAAQVRMMLPVGFWSAFLNNTPVVALMIPIVTMWSRAIKISPGQLMIPLSYVSELGGVCTLIGTSTNLIVKDLYDTAVAESKQDLRPLQIFSQSVYGIPVAVMGIVYIVVLGRRILPGHVKSKDRGVVEEEPLRVGMLVTGNSPVIAKQVSESGLLSMEHLSLVHIERDGKIIGPPLLATTYIQLYDVLYIAGDMTQVDELAAQLALNIVTDEFDTDFAGPANRRGGDEGLTDALSQPLLAGPPSHQAMKPKNGEPGSSDSSTHGKSPRADNSSILKLVHVTIKEGAPLVGHTIREARFRTRFDAAVVHIRRDGRQLEGQLGGVELRAGDELLVSAGGTFDSASADAAANFTDVRFVSAPYKQFMMPMVVPQNSNLIGKTIEQAGLRGLQDGFVVALQQGSTRVDAVAPDVSLQAGDVVWLAGNGTNAVRQLRNIKGLEPQNKTVNKALEFVKLELLQAVLASNSYLVGKSLKETDFEQRYGCTVLALHREGERILSDMNSVHLQTGDVLLVEAPDTFVKLHEDDPAFALVSNSGGTPTKWNRSILALLLLVVMVVGQIVQSVLYEEKVPLLVSACLVVAAMLLSGCMSVAQAHKSLKWDIYLTVACAIGISEAMQSSGLAAVIAKGLIKAGERIGGDVAIQAALYITTALLSNLIANNAAAALLFPVVFSVSRQQGLRLDRLAFLLMFGASSAFMTPYGYQTNMMVKDVGGYTPMDFAKFGGPFQIWQGVVTIVIMAIPDYWYITWIVVAIIAAITCLPHLIRVRATLRQFKRHATFKPASPAAEQDTQLSSVV